MAHNIRYEDPIYVPIWASYCIKTQYFVKIGILNQRPLFALFQSFSR